MVSPILPPKKITFALQHFAAGMVLAAVSQELVPSLTAAEDQASVIALIVGFTLGVTMMIGIQVIVGDHDQAEEEPPLELEPGEHPGLLGVLMQEREQLLAERSMEDGAPELGGREHSGSRRPPKEGKRAGSSMSHFAYREEERFGRAGSQDGSPSDLVRAPPPPRFPWTFCFAVLVDSFMDGLLIGLALVAGNAGLPFGIAIGVEMMFLGLTFATAVLPQKRSVAVVAVFSGPVFILTGALCGGMAASALSAQPAAMVGCTAFGASALLYMVAEELLLAAHEEGGEHVWWIDVQVYTGFLCSILMEKAIKAQGLSI